MSDLIIGSVARREVGYIREDLAGLRANVASLRERASNVSPQRRTSAILLAGVLAAVHGFSLWSEALAWVVLGVAMIVAAFTLVDLDPPKRRRRVVRKKTAP